MLLLHLMFSALLLDNPLLLLLPRTHSLCFGEIFTRASVLVQNSAYHSDLPQLGPSRLSMLSSLFSKRTNTYSWFTLPAFS
jgi:hypothetical protein